MAELQKQKQGICWPSKVRRVNEQWLRKWFDEWFKDLGIDEKPRGAKALREAMRKTGIDPRENLASRGIIEMREE